MHIEIPYSPRTHQAELHDLLSKHRFAVLNCHRRFGKTVAVLNHLIRSALTHPLKNPRFAYIAPTYKQAKNVAWDYIKQFTGKIPGVKYNETEIRRLTILELKRIQSFPDDFIFFGSKTSKNLQIGNAVPPILGEIIGKQVVKSIFNVND